MFPRKTTVVVFIGILAHLTGSIATAQGWNVYQVDSVFDNPKMRSTDRDGRITLREAIVAATTGRAFGDAQAGTDRDQIKFDRLSPRQSTIYLNGPLIVDVPQSGDVLVLEGPGNGFRNPTIDGRGRHQIFDLHGVANLHFKGIDLANGKSQEGGAIRTAWGRVHFADGEIRNCSAVRGGAVFVRGSTWFSSKSASFIDNSAGDQGGAIYIEGNTRSEFVLNTMARNIAGNAGGAIFIQKAKYTLPGVKIRFTTIANNMVFGGKYSSPYGGGVAEAGYSPLNGESWQTPLHLYSSLIADNFIYQNNLLYHNDVKGHVGGSSEHNLIGAADGDIGIIDDNLNQVGEWYAAINPRLTMFGRNGSSSSRNYVPAANSPAIDRGGVIVTQNSNLIWMGTTSSPYPYDQRGEGFLRSTQINRFDIGAIERQ